MEDTHITSDGKVEAVVGTIVWVRRRNGSWWPGRIISEEELLTANLLSPRSGTPVKLLGREDGSVDWYNIEKSKRVKAFRCGDFKECIERAKALAGHSGKRREKYARREDAILDALELEKQQLGSTFGWTEPSKTRKRGEISGAASRGSGMETLSGVRCAPCCRIGHPERQSVHRAPEVAQSCRLSAQADTRPKFKWNEHKQEMETDDEKLESIPRMRGLQDLGLKIADMHGKSQLAMLGNSSGNRCREASGVTHATAGCGLEYNGAAPNWKKKRSPGDFSSKRRDRKRPLVQVLKNSVKLSNTAESLSSRRCPSIGIKSCADGNGSLHMSPRTDISELPARILPECSSAVPIRINLSACENSQIHSKLMGSLDQKGSLSSVKFSSPSIPGSKCSMSCTYHGMLGCLSMGSIDKHSSNAEPHTFNKLKDVVSGCRVDEGSAPVKVRDELGSTGHQSPYSHRGKKSRRSQKLVLFPLQPNEDCFSEHLNNLAYKSCQSFENGSQKFLEEADKLQVNQTVNVNHMFSGRAVGDYEAESFGFSSKVRSKRLWKARSQDFFSGVVQDFVPAFQSDKGIITEDRKELMNVEFLPSDRDDGGGFDCPFNYCANNGVNNKNCRNQMLPKIPSKSSKEADHSLRFSNLRKSTPKIQLAAKRFISQNQKHPHALQKGMQSSKSDQDICRYSSTANFKYPDAIWFDVHVDSLAKSQKESVPMVLMASKLNRKPIIGHPVVVKVVELNKFHTFCQGQSAVNGERLDEVQHFWQTGRRTTRQRGRHLSFSFTYDGQREACSSTASRLIDQSRIIAGSEDGTKCIGGHSRIPLLIPQNVEPASKQNIFDRKRREFLHKAALSKKVLRRVCLSSKRTRTRTLSSIAEEQCNRPHKHQVEYENEQFLTSLAEKSHSWIKHCHVNEVVNSSDFQKSNLKIHDPNMALTKHPMSQWQAQELPVVAPSAAPVSACIPVRVALARLKTAVCEDHKVFLS